MISAGGPLNRFCSKSNIEHVHLVLSASLSSRSAGDPMRASVKLEHDCSDPRRHERQSATHPLLSWPRFVCPYRDMSDASAQCVSRRGSRWRKIDRGLDHSWLVLSHWTVRGLQSSCRANKA